jgi:hypothetical protein
MWHPWRLPDNFHNLKLYSDGLTFDRWLLVLYTVDIISMIVVLVRTYRNSKFAYLYTCATMMLLAPVLSLISDLLFNWYYGCSKFSAVNEKCHGEKSEEWIHNIADSLNTCDCLANLFYFLGHFLFAYRYFEVAEMFGRED